jgi:hypothetical protein
MNAEHFARVTPIVGETLHTATVALAGLPHAAPLVHYLAASGVGRWCWCVPDAEIDSGVHPAMLRAELRARHGAALPLDIRALRAQRWAAAVAAAPPDLIIMAVGDAAQRTQAWALAQRIGAPALLVDLPTRLSATRVLVALPGDSLEEALPHRLGAETIHRLGAETIHRLGAETIHRLGAETIHRLGAETIHRIVSTVGDFGETPDAWEWATSAPLIAGIARALLLRGTPYQRDDIEQLLASGVRSLIIGGAHPFDIAWETVEAAYAPHAPHFRTPAIRRGRILIAGLGSLGSEAAIQLAHQVEGFVLADPDTVAAPNPARQAYYRAQIGLPKAHALAENLSAAGATTRALPIALTDEGEIAALIAREPVDAALVATGATAGFAIARVLRAAGIPHVVGRCYPRARYWEAILVDGAHGPPFDAIRSRIPLGPAPAPTPEQIAAYSDAGALEAEPATLIESGWAAAWMARCVAQLLAPVGLRERWLLELLSAGRTCIIGGIGVEPTDAGAAYAVAVPGQIHAWGSAQIRGV